MRRLVCRCVEKSLHTYHKAHLPTVERESADAKADRTPVKNMAVTGMFFKIATISITHLIGRALVSPKSFTRGSDATKRPTPSLVWAWTRDLSRKSKARQTIGRATKLWGILQNDMEWTGFPVFPHRSWRHHALAVVVMTAARHIPHFPTWSPQLRFCQFSGSPSPSEHQTFCPRKPPGLTATLAPKVTSFLYL
jgi:hypothetical protein